VTEWNEQNCMDAWSGLSRCIEAVALFCKFYTQNNKCGMHLPTHGKQCMAFATWNEGTRLL